MLKQSNSVEEAKELLFAWDAQIAEEGARIIYKRKAFCAKLKVYAKNCHAALSNGKETLTLDYVTQIKGDTVAEISKNYAEALGRNIEKDFQLRYTTTGCQRDDISLKINDVDVRSFGSQGQLRTAALSLKLAELNIFKEIIGETPILILDDVLSELDYDRQKRLLNFDSDLQILLTTATKIEDDLIQTDCKRFTIANGVCKESND